MCNLLTGLNLQILTYFLDKQETPGHTIVACGTKPKEKLKEKSGLKLKIIAKN